MSTGMRQRYWPSLELVGNYALFSRFNNLDVFFNRFQRNNVNVGIEARVPLFAAATGPSVALARTRPRPRPTSTIRQQQDRIDLDVLAAPCRRRARRRPISRSTSSSSRSPRRPCVSRAPGLMRAAPTVSIFSGRWSKRGARAWDEFYQADFARQRGQRASCAQITGELNPAVSLTT